MLKLPKGSVLTYELSLYRKIIIEVIIFIHKQNVYQIFKRLKSLNHLTYSHMKYTSYVYVES